MSDQDFDVAPAASRRAWASRRGVLGLLAFGAGAPWAGAAGAQACVDLAARPPAEISLRRSLKFQTASPDPKRTCGGCAFFTAKAAGCGQCAMLSGGPVAAASVCDAWAARA